MTFSNSLYQYNLPRELIAQQPLTHRADARLLVVRRQTDSCEHCYVRDLPLLLQQGDTLVLNDSRVIPASLVGHRTQTGGQWRGLFLAEKVAHQWQLMARTRGKVTPGEAITLIDRMARNDLALHLLEKQPDGIWVARPEPAEDAITALERVGRVPLPPYIRGGQMVDADCQNYQTVYAQNPGSVAAPTAGLHFTNELLDQLKRRGILDTRLTLHVGRDTFQPLRSSSLEEHTMHAEWAELRPQAATSLRACRAARGRIVAVGTTSVRVLETASADGRLNPWRGLTKLFIRPPHKFRAVDALLTNFHLPCTTLLVLVSTFAGEALIRHAYQEAIRERYRFYSYGDAMLIL